MTPRNLPLIGAGYNPTAWCTNPACHAPISAYETTCPDCGAEQTPLIRATQPRDPLPLDTLRNFDLGVLRVYRGAALEHQRAFSMKRVWAAQREVVSEQYRAACALGGDE